MSEGTHDKALLRERLLVGRLRIPVEMRAALSSRASERLLALPAVRSANTIAFYAAVGSEADPSLAAEACMEAGKRVVFPRVTSTSKVLEFAAATLDGLLPGPHRTREPPPVAPRAGLHEIDCIVVPGLAFDASGHRLGRGGGFYDATLAEFPRRATRVGFAFESQIIDAVPTERHDVPVDVVVTDARVLPAAHAASDASH